VLARYRYVLFASLMLALAGAVGYGLAHRPPVLVLTVLPPPPTALPTGTPIAGPSCCHVVGAVSAPGVYTLPPGARVRDAIRAAGGATADADLERVNLATLVQDQQQIVVPNLAKSTSGAEGGALVDVNVADGATLQTLPGIGPVMAERIIAYREAHGRFHTLEDLIQVKGIGEATLEKLRPWITISDGKE
jgi:competence protein ComEA